LEDIWKKLMEFLAELMFVVRKSIKKLFTSLFSL